MNKNSACILLIGNELLNGDTRDKNAWYLALKLAEIGIKLENCSVVPDNLEQIINELNRLTELAPLVFTCGGIGPTSDDMTREAISRLVGVKLEQREEAVEKLNNYAASQNRPLNKNSFKQALFPKGSIIIPNNAGTAEAFSTRHKQSTIITLPGVPNEVTSIFENQVLNLIPKLYPNLKKQFQKSFRLFGLSESHVGTEIDSLELSSEVIVAYRPHFPELLLVFNCENEALLNDAVTKVIQKIGPEYFYSEEKKNTLAKTVFELLKSKSKTVSFAESCTGGLLADAFVSLPGVSNVMMGSAVTYSDSAKAEILGVSSISKYGAVSEAVAIEMAEGAKNKFHSDYAISITGIAGPDGGTEEKPVGTTCIALASPNEIDVFTFKFAWDRERNRIYSAAIATEILRRKLLNLRLSWERK